VFFTKISLEVVFYFVTLGALGWLLLKLPTVVAIYSVISIPSIFVALMVSVHRKLVTRREQIETREIFGNFFDEEVIPENERGEVEELIEEDLAAVA
jgi:hypothetical protein